MPFPQNLETARDVERVVRDNGAVPATIAILDGVIHVGTLTSFLSSRSWTPPYVELAPKA
jgi:pseudouridine-5'-phosphate glycosidase